ncbi:hypothetical protein IQ250_03215 [Pseudanabaenaceae cyanobacterium LEGE 13415]|nr:hypothetical protein [Pseudanabaenaceae cyanobacterium LEGE 13415]
MLALNPSHADALFDRGMAYYQLDGEQQALADLQQSAELFLNQNRTVSHAQVMNIIRQMQQSQIALREVV